MAATWSHLVFCYHLWPSWPAPWLLVFEPVLVDCGSGAAAWGHFCGRIVRAVHGHPLAFHIHMYVERRLYIPIGGLLLPWLPRLTASVQLLILVVREASRPHIIIIIIIIIIVTAWLGHRGHFRSQWKRCIIYVLGRQLLLSLLRDHI